MAYLQVWKGYVNRALLRWAKRNGVTVDSVDHLNLRREEMLVVDRSSLKELIDLTVNDEAFAHYMAKRPIILIEHGPSYALNQLEHDVVAAVVSSHHLSDLASVICPRQLTAEVDAFGDLADLNPDAFGKATLGLDDFLIKWGLRAHLQNGCHACSARVNAQILLAQSKWADVKDKAIRMSEVVTEINRWTFQLDEILATTSMDLDTREKRVSNLVNQMEVELRFKVLWNDHQRGMFSAYIREVKSRHLGDFGSPFGNGHDGLESLLGQILNAHPDDPMMPAMGPLD